MCGQFLLLRVYSIYMPLFFRNMIICWHLAITYTEECKLGFFLHSVEQYNIVNNMFATVLSEREPIFWLVGSESRSRLF